MKTALATPDKHCPRGRCYSEMDARIALAEYLINGYTIEPNVWECPECETWHIGKPKNKRVTCPIQGKLIYWDRESAERELERIKKMPDGRREECRVYRCESHWHLTSKKEWQAMKPPIPPDAQMRP